MGGGGGGGGQLNATAQSRLRIQWSGSKPWPESFHCCVLVQDTFSTLIVPLTIGTGEYSAGGSPAMD